MINSNINILSNNNTPICNIIKEKLKNSINTKIAVAFLKISGIKAIEKSLLSSIENNGCFELIVGLDFLTTDPESIEYFINLEEKHNNVRFFCFGDRGYYNEKYKTNITFHPKIYLFKNKNEFTSIIGSSNLTNGGLSSNFEVNSMFIEKQPNCYSKLNKIYNSAKNADSLFYPNENYLTTYKKLYNLIQANKNNISNDVDFQNEIKNLSNLEKPVLNNIPTIRSMIIECLTLKKIKGIYSVNLQDIYDYLDNKIVKENLTSNYKLDTFHNSIRAELNHNEISANGESSKLYERVGTGFYSLAKNNQQ